MKFLVTLQSNFIGLSFFNNMGFVRLQFPSFIFYGLLSILIIVSEGNAQSFNQINTGENKMSGINDSNFKLTEFNLESNRRAIELCLLKLKKSYTKQDLKDLNNLKTSIERVYFFRPALLLSRQFEKIPPMKTQVGASVVKGRALWVFTANSNSLPNKEKYQAKYLLKNSSGQYVEQNVPAEYQNMSRTQLQQFQNIEGETLNDEWVEDNKLSETQHVKFKIVNYKVSEIEFTDKSINKKLTCRAMKSKAPLCQCL